ncbi:uncharacterized mitochondrial protein AtMg00810-like [Benincasa hispida]|uniref:uncharacterized mitochondrial protein AtMg00810-like n=1 Tax=Benincasa hispida TaxID=102211 RepID=UPI0019015C07|nr:uncharacterized mitochondrial protein AtMg00810-like [Benincasa hispida]
MLSLIHLSSYRSIYALILLLVYVDDVIITGIEPRVINELVIALDSKFALKDLGQLHYFLGVQLHTVPNGVLLNKKKYIEDLLHRLDLGDLKPAPSPSVLYKQLSISYGTSLDDPYIYWSTIGALQYLTSMRPNTVKRVLRYVSGTRHFGLYIQHGSDLSVSTFSDADWEANIDNRKSVATYCIFLGGNLVSWSSKKQSVVARSNTESEYRALASAFAEIIWVQQLLSEIGFKHKLAPVLWCDNLRADALAVNPVFHVQTKNIEIDIHFVCDQVLSG